MDIKDIEENLEESRQALQDILTNLDNPMLLNKERLKIIRTIAQEYFDFWGNIGE